jgi:hypothetical protein
VKQENSEIDKKEIQRAKAQSVINEKKKKEISFQIPKKKEF